MKKPLTYSTPAAIDCEKLLRHPRYATAALTHALALAVLAPDQLRRNRAIRLAEKIAAGYTADQVAGAKRNAEKIFRK